MTPWTERPRDVANLLNPAFCGAVLVQAAKGYDAAVDKPLPWPLAFLVLPVVLHRRTRDVLGSRARQFHVWLQQHPEVRIDFAERARKLVPVAREALTFVLQRRALLPTRGRLRVPPPLGRVRRPRGEPADCLRKAELLGRLYGRAGGVASIYMMWGVRP